MVVYRRTTTRDGKEVKEVSVNLSEIVAFVSVLNLVGLPWIWFTRESVDVWSLIIAGVIWLVVAAGAGANASHRERKV